MLKKNNRIVPIKIELGQLVADSEQSHFKIGYKLEAKQQLIEHTYQGGKSHTCPIQPYAVKRRLATQLAYEII